MTSREYFLSGNLKVLNDSRDFKSSMGDRSNGLTSGSCTHLPHVGSLSETESMAYDIDRGVGESGSFEIPGCGSNNGAESAFSYSIHGIVDVESPVPLSELASFEAEETNRAHLVIGPLSSKQSSLGSRKISVGNESATYSEHFGSLGAKVHFDFSGTPIQVSVSKLLLKSRHVLYVNVVEPLLRLLLASKGYILLHSACLCSKGNGYLISAPPDTGKTTTILKCIRDEAFGFLSDDMTIVDPSGRLLSFPKPMTISAHTFHALSPRNERRRDISLKIRGYAHSRTGRNILRILGRPGSMPILTINAIAQYFVRPPKVNITEVMNYVKICGFTCDECKTGHGAKLRAIYFLTKGRPEICPLSKEKALTGAILNSDDAFGFPPYDKIFPHLSIEGFSFSDLMAEESQILSSVLSNSDHFRLSSDNYGWNNMLIESIDTNQVT